MPRFYKNKKTGKRYKVDSVEDRKFVPIRINVPAHMWEALQKIAKTKGRPQSRLLAYALYNELESPVPFNFEEGPPADFSLDRYALAGERVKQAIKNERYGMPKDVLILLAETWGLSKDEMRGGIEYLIQKRMVSLVHQNISYFDYPLDYMYLVLPHHQSQTIDDKALKEKRGGRGVKPPPKERGPLDDL